MVIKFVSDYFKGFKLRIFHFHDFPPCMDRGKTEYDVLNLNRQYFTLATMDNCKKFAVIVSITTICSYINFSHSIWQRTAPKQLRARLTRTLSLVWGRTDKFCQVELNALKEKEENLLWWALRENWRSLKYFKRVIVEKNRNENI